jgi:hypothetical protein
MSCWFSAKGCRERTLPFGRKAGEALDRYLRARARHKDAELPWLWLGKRGRLTEWGLVMMLRRRGAQAGLPGLHPHQFRHTFAHQWLAQGGTETDLMRIAGWKSRQMLQRYGPRPPPPALARRIGACRRQIGCRWEAPSRVVGRCSLDLDWPDAQVGPGLHASKLHSDNPSCLSSANSREHAGRLP